jgi:hypothetical protein
MKQSDHEILKQRNTINKILWSFLLLSAATNFPYKYSHIHTFTILKLLFSEEKSCFLQSSAKDLVAQ